MNKALSSPKHRTQSSQAIIPCASPERLLSFDEVQNRVSFKSSFIYLKIQRGEFPKPIKVGSSSRWLESEVQQWILDQIESNSSSKSDGVRS